LHVEGLEERCVPTVTYHGGALLTHVETQAVYLGSGWNSPTVSAQTGALDTYLASLVKGPYLEALTRAGYGVGTGTASAGVVDPANLPDGTFLQDGNIQAELESLVYNGKVAAPDANRLYVVYVQPNVVVSDGSLDSTQGLLGYHGAFAGVTAAGKVVDVHYAVMAYPGGDVGNAALTASAFDTLAAVSSHEVAESATDPNVGYKALGWYDNFRGEIGDITEGDLTRLNGYLVQQVAGPNDQPLSLTSFAGLPGTTAALAASATHVRPGGQVTLTIQVTPASGGGTAGGLVTLLDGNQIIGTVRLGSNGKATVTLSAGRGSTGTHTLTAVFDGSGTLLDSFSNSITLTVG
jgi:hypothetical protein